MIDHCYPTAPRVMLTALLVLVFQGILVGAEDSPAKIQGWLDTETVRTREGKFEFRHGNPTPDSTRALLELRTYHRALEVFMTHGPAVSMVRMREGFANAGSTNPRQVLLFEQNLDSVPLLLTGDPTLLFGGAFLDLALDGPTVLEVPAGLEVTLNDMWMRWVLDIGPDGPDQGKGGRFLILPQDYEGDMPGDYDVALSPTYGLLMIMTIDPSNNRQRALEVMKQLRIYPLLKVQEPPRMQFVNASGTYFNTVPPDNFAYFPRLSQLIHAEPAHAISPMERFHLATLGIEKSRPFMPDESMRSLLDEAARLGAAMVRASAFNALDETHKAYKIRNWVDPIPGGSHQFSPNGHLDLDLRAAYSFLATLTSPVRFPRQPGRGTAWIRCHVDGRGELLHGGESYLLKLPGGIPARRAWSVAVYDPVSRSLLKNGSPASWLGSQSDPYVNPDGSIDIYFGPKPPVGRVRNWIPTDPEKAWFAVLRLQGPEAPFFNQTWLPGNIERGW